MGASDFVLAKQKLEPLIVFETIVCFINVPFFCEKADAAFFAMGMGSCVIKRLMEAIFGHMCLILENAPDI